MLDRVPLGSRRMSLTVVVAAAVGAMAYAAPARASVTVSDAVLVPPLTLPTLRDATTATLEELKVEVDCRGDAAARLACAVTATYRVANPTAQPAEVTLARRWEPPGAAPLVVVRGADSAPPS